MKEKIINFYNTRPARKTIYLLIITLLVIFIPIIVGSYLPSPFSFWLFSALFSVLGIFILNIIIVFCILIYNWIVYDKDSDWDDSLSIYFDTIGDKIDDFLLK